MAFQGLLSTPRQHTHITGKTMKRAIRYSIVLRRRSPMKPTMAASFWFMSGVVGLQKLFFAGGLSVRFPPT
jgi:hypothetical protein